MNLAKAGFVSAVGVVEFSRATERPSMNNTICYLNTDLDLVCAENLTDLAQAFEISGTWPLCVTKGDDGMWHARFETNESHAEPAPNIAQMLAIIESLAEPLRSLWTRCTLREFDIGYDCGAEPWAFNQGLPADLLGRIAAAGASLRITLYPDRDENVVEKSSE